MAEPPTILVVDDEPDMREMLEEYLIKQGFVVLTADGGARLRQLMAEHTVDVVLLDIRMPGEDGLSLARFLRQQSQVGIIMLTAVGEMIDRVVGLEMGADDYVTKPFDPRELLARIKSVLRRLSDTARQEPEATAQQRVRIGCCLLDLEAHKLFSAEGVELPLTAMEFDLLKTFATHPNQVLSRDQLLEMAHDRGLEPFDRSIDIRISRLRRKVEVDPSTPQALKTVRGAGYIFVPHESR